SPEVATAAVVEMPSASSFRNHVPSHPVPSREDELDTRAADLDDRAGLRGSLGGAAWPVAGRRVAPLSSSETSSTTVLGRIENRSTPSLGTRAAHIGKYGRNRTSRLAIAICWTSRVTSATLGLESRPLSPALTGRRRARRGSASTIPELIAM